jgi:hypothetical protein
MENHRRRRSRDRQGAARSILEGWNGRHDVQAERPWRPARQAHPSAQGRDMGGAATRHTPCSLRSNPKWRDHLRLGLPIRSRCGCRQAPRPTRAPRRTSGLANPLAKGRPVGRRTHMTTSPSSRFTRAASGLMAASRDPRDSQISLPPAGLKIQGRYVSRPGHEPGPDRYRVAVTLALVNGLLRLSS